MNLDFISELFIPIVLVACLIVGYCIKHIPRLAKVSNDYIPAILAILGAILACVANTSITLENIVYGALTGLASTGLHQAFKRIIERVGQNNE
ncbi:phage holin family protein [Lachnospiraceae bacterium ASD3451]|uniref:phage holin family protein n=1 Tax=Diplocloster agilis TaxID=2850323 RepID=UPI001DBD0A7F|nr:phage holin family protein [Diplocloster agilis]MBU9746872.1 phage holin family protein [Diplocloster agilis]